MDAKKLLLTGVLWALGLVAPAVGSAATFTVNTTVDTAVAGGCVSNPSCSLREAVAAANNSADSADTVEIPAGTYKLSLGELQVAGTGRVTVHGAGPRSTTIDAQGTSRVVFVTADDVVFEGLTVTGGVAPIGIGNFPGDGGGILVEGSGTESLVLNQVTVAGNSASLNGGGVSLPAESVSATSLVVNASTIANNRISGGALEGMGGGIFAFGDLTVTNSTITGNSVENPGLNEGGGILAGLSPTETDGTSVNLLNTTVAGNSVAAGGIGGGFTINNPTAGVLTTFTVKNTILAANTAGGAAADCGKVVATTSANNLSSDASCLFTDAASKQNANPQLGPLQDNGGPTNTLALPAGSPAIDAGTNAGCPPTDQRGVSRPQGSACDIGAYEREASPPPPAAAAADLKLTLKPKPKHPRVGGKLAFRLTVVNRGPSAATGVVVKGKAPASARKIKGAKKIKGKPACKLGKAKGGKRKFSCRLGTLAAAKRVKLKILVKRPTAPGKLRAKARVSSTVADPIAKNNKAKAVAKVKEAG